MNANRKYAYVTQASSDYSRELSQRVERLELLRCDARANHDPIRIAFIELQIKNTLLEWCDSFVADDVASDREDFRVCRSPSRTVN